MQKIELESDDEKQNQRQVLRAINNSPIDRSNMTFNFVKAGDQYWCIFATCDEERSSMPQELKNTSITYKALLAKSMG